MRVPLGELIKEGRGALEAKVAFHESVIGSLMIVAKDWGGKIQRSSDFIARFKDKKAVDNFMRNARMEYPAIDTKIRSKKTPGGIELTLTSRDARKLESY